jgi:2-polyprenyl-3-methyl-5-hydroxy-6-metoxy-1,4-benzoquinol methylase
MAINIENARAYVDADIATYLDPEVGYPANHFAFLKGNERFHTNGVQSLIEVGVGHGNAIPVFTAEGFTVAGFDHKPELVAESKVMSADFGQDPEYIILADIEDATSYSTLYNAGNFDALVAMGVMPHVGNEELSLRNMAALLKPGGEVLIEYRNSLFSLFTFNRFTHEFILEDLLSNVSSDSRAIVDSTLRGKFDVTKPAPASSKFHNPFEVEKQFAELGFTDIEILPFHYHAMLPSVESQNPEVFRRDSIALESEDSGWKGLFLCSAYVVHAKTPVHS